MSKGWKKNARNWPLNVKSHMRKNYAIGSKKYSRRLLTKPKKNQRSKRLKLKHLSLKSNNKLSRPRNRSKRPMKRLRDSDNWRKWPLKLNARSSKRIKIMWKCRSGKPLCKKLSSRLVSLRKLREKPSRCAMHSNLKRLNDSRLRR